MTARDISVVETGSIRKSWQGKINIALVYPNTYRIGMSNLGFQSVYSILNNMKDVACERAFLPEESFGYKKTIRTLETKRPVSQFDIIAFSISFESDFPNLLAIVQKTGLPLRSSARGDPHPLLIAGGVACFLNPEPVSPFLDLIFVGEAEGLLPRFFSVYDPSITRKTLLKKLAARGRGFYVPYLYKADYNQDNTLAAMTHVEGVPGVISRVYAENLSMFPTCSSIVTPDTIFSDTFLVEVSRGCTHGCRFCSAGFVYRPPRFRTTESLGKCIKNNLTKANRLGLMGTALSDLPGISSLLENLVKDEIQISFSSLRADALSPKLAVLLKKCGVKTATIAPDAGSQRMRDIINKGINEKDILYAVKILVDAGIPNLKLYFMVGLPFETQEDVDAVIILSKQIKEVFLQASRKKKHIGTITLSINPFVPKPFTPFQWSPMDSQPSLKEKISKIKNGLRKTPNINVQAESPKKAYIQALISRGDRRVAEILEIALKNKMNWPKTLKQSPFDHEFYVTRKRSLDEKLPWEILDHGIKKSFLKNEYKKAKNAKTTMPCPMKSCEECGICMGRPIIHESGS